MRTQFALLGTLLLASESLVAQQPATIRGKVVESGTGQPIVAAQVIVGDDRRFTDGEGHFLSGPVRPGRQFMEVRAIGYSAARHELVILPGQALSLVFQLERVIPQIDSLTVVVSREPVISGEELARRGRDLATALNGWEGIIVSRTGSGNEAVPQIRGSAADEVLVLVDGYALNDPFTGRADLSRIAAGDVESISLFRGVQTARAGSRAMAGVLQINTRQVRHPELQLGIGSAQTRQARLAGGTGSATLALNVESLPRDYSVELQNGGETDRANAGGEIWGINGRARLGLDWTVRSSISNRGLPGTTVNPTPAARARDRSLLIGARTGRDSWFSTSLQWLDTRAGDTSPPPGFLPYDNHTWGWGGTAEAGVHRLARLGRWKGDYSITADTRHDRFDGDAVRDDATFSRAGAGLAGSLTTTGPAGLWTIAPALRFDWFTGESSVLASGRFDLRLRSGNTELSAAVANGVTVPALADLLFRDGVGVALNPDLRPERVRWETELGMSRSFAVLGWTGALRIAGFYGRIEDMILWTPDFRNIWSPGNFAVLRRGGEANLDLRAGEFVVSGGTAYNSVTYDVPGGSQVPYRPRFSASLQGSWTPGAWRLSAGWNHLGTRYSRNRGMNPLPRFDLFHLSAERQIGRFAIEAEIRDLTDTRPVYIAGFPTPGRTVHLTLNLELP